MPGNTKSKKPSTRCVVRDNAESDESNNVKRTRKRIESPNNKMDFVPKPKFILQLLKQTGYSRAQDSRCISFQNNNFIRNRHPFLRHVLDPVYCYRCYEI